MKNAVDTAAVFKQPVDCFGCGGEFYFKLSAIAENQRLKCPSCGADIDLRCEAYESQVASVRDTIATIGHLQRL